MPNQPPTIDPKPPEPARPLRVECIDETVAAILSAKTPAEKFAMICDANEAARQIAEAGMRYRNPGMSAEEVSKAVSARMLQ